MPASLKREVLFFLFFCILVCSKSLFAGSAGVDNGDITGTVHGDGTPLSGANIVAVRESSPELIRSTKSLANGSYCLTNLPLGKYVLGFSKQGFETLTTESGSESQQSAVGSQIRVFVESGRTSQAPRVNLRKLPDGSPGNVRLNLIDGVTGEKIEHANLVLGSEVAKLDGEGSYSARVTPKYDEDGNLQEQRLVANADGYEQKEENILLPGGSSTTQSIVLSPKMVTLSGVVKLDPTLDPADYSEIEVLVEGVPRQFSQGSVVNDTGLFEVRVPASNGAKTRQFNLQFLLNGHNLASLKNVIAPRAGVRTINQSAQIDAKSTAASGQVMLSDGTIPKTGTVNMAVIVELGKATPIQNGSYSFGNIPIGRELNLRVTVRNPQTQAIEQADLSFTVRSGGGSFALPMVVTSPVTGP